MKYKCKICGYIHDEEKEGVRFDDLPADWKCPWCAAPKSMFEPEGGQKKEAVKKPVSLPKGDVKLSYGQLAAICSNLARGCEKQYKTEEQKLFRQIADFYTAITPVPEKADMDQLMKLLQADLDENYGTVDAIAKEKGDRGTQRIKVWGEKVTQMAQLLLTRYMNEGEDFLINTNVWVCSVCGFIYVGDNAPEKCPVCKVPDWKFEKI